MKIQLILILLTLLPLVSSAHWITGYVKDALDSTSPNGRTVSLLNTNTSEEMFGIVGPTGASGYSNVYMIDCELLPSSCSIGDVLNLSLVDDGTGHTTEEIIQVTVTSGGFDLADNMSMVTPFFLTNVTVDDSFTSPENEIDLSEYPITKVFCTGLIETYSDIDSIDSVKAKFYASSSYPGDTDDNNTHYTNNSCYLNKSYGASNQGELNCSFDIQYYANSETWTCQVNATDNLSLSVVNTDATFINPFLRIEINDTINFTTVDATTLSEEKIIQVINLGNVRINLSLSGYGQTPGDGLSMVCTDENLSIGNMKYNLTASNPGAMTLSQSSLYYTNLTSSPVTESFGLNFRQNDATNEAIDETYWRVYVQRGSRDTCQGNITIGVTQS